MIKLIENSLLITNFGNKKVIKLNKYVAKRKTQLNNLYIFMQGLDSSFIAFLLFFYTFISCFRSSSFLLSCFGSFFYLLSCFIPTLISESLVILLFFFCLIQLLLILHLQFLKHSNKLYLINFYIAV